MEISIKHLNKNIPLCCFNTNNIIGEEILMPKTTYKYTVTTKSDKA